MLSTANSLGILGKRAKSGFLENKFAEEDQLTGAVRNEFCKKLLSNTAFVQSAPTSANGSTNPHPVLDIQVDPVIDCASEGQHQDDKQSRR